MSKLKSQIESMTGTAASAPATRAQSQVERYIAADLKGGEHKRGFMLSLITSTIREAYKGNNRDIIEALKLCDGKAVKARAYLAGFATIKDISKAAYTGAWLAKENAPIRAQVETDTERLTLAFASAYDAVFAADKVDRDIKKAAKAASAPAPVVETAPASTGETEAAREHDNAVAVDNAVTSMLTMVRAGGILTLAQLEELTEACRAAETAALLALASAPAPKARAPRKAKAKQTEATA